MPTGATPVPEVPFCLAAMREAVRFANRFAGRYRFLPGVTFFPGQFVVRMSES